MIYTTYFAQLRNLPESIIPVSICGKAPSWYDDFCHRHLVAQWLRANGFSCTEWMKG